MYIRILCMLLITQESRDIFGDIFEMFDGGEVHINHIGTKAKINTRLFSSRILPYI